MRRQQSVTGVTIHNVADYNAIQAAVTEYARAYILALRALEPRPSYETIAELLDCSKAWVQQLNNPAKYGTRGAGPETEHALAVRHHGGSVDALRAAALNLIAGGSLVIEEDGRKIILGAPNSGAAILGRELP